LTPAVGTVIAERFRLVRPLGQGGMGAVWLAEHLGLEVLCAIKFIQSEVKDSAELRRRFEREAKIAAQIRSSHVVHILDHGVWEGAPYMAMEYLEGEDLEARLCRAGRLSPLETAAITAQVSRALMKAHAAGLVHRDLKPANIFLTRDDDQEIVKVLDFGIAKDITPRVANTTKTGSLLGTPAYMSPEQAQGVKAVDHRSDLWSLAVVIYECLTGELPFYSEAFGDLLLKIMVQPLPVPSTVAPVPPGFDAWWARAAARDPNERFQSAREMSDALVIALGLSTGSGVDLRSGSSGSFRFPSFDPISMRPPAVSDIPPERISGLPMEASARSGVPALSMMDAATLVTAESGKTPLPASMTPLGVAGIASAPGSTARPLHLTAGPISTPLGPRPSWSGGVRRVAASMLAGVAVTGIAAFLLLRNLGAPEVAADPTLGAEPARSPVAPAEPPAPEVQARGDVPAATPTGSAVPEAPPSPSAGANTPNRLKTGNGPRAPGGGTASSAGRSTPPSGRTRPTDNPTNKTRNPRDFGF